MHKTLVTAIAALALSEAFAIQGTITTETESISGDITWQARNKQYIVSVKKGNTMVDMERKLADVVSLDIPEPKELAKAIQAVESGKGSSVIAVLAKIVTDYRMLKWDKPAGRYLAIAYIDAGNAQKAFDTCAPIIAEDKTAAYSGELASAYWQSLLKLGKRDQLEGLLKKAMSSGDRQASAAALVMRGDIIVAGSNDQPDELKRALRDGYLRVVLMYQDASCVRERADALQKAAACFDKLGQSSRAEALREQLKAI